MYIEAETFGACVLCASCTVTAYHIDGAQSIKCQAACDSPKRQSCYLYLGKRFGHLTRFTRLSTSSDKLSFLGCWLGE